MCGNEEQQSHLPTAIFLTFGRQTSSFRVTHTILPPSLVIRHRKYRLKRLKLWLKLNFSFCFRRHESPPSPKDLALYSIALNSLCRDPRQYYGHDLIGNINHQEMLLDLEFAVSSLAVCTSGSHVRKRQIRRLLDITEHNKDISVGGCMFRMTGMELFTSCFSFN